MSERSRILLASAARTADINSPDQVGYIRAGIHVIIDVTVDPALASVVPHIEGYDPASDSYYDILIGAAIVATGTTVLKVHPGIPAVANLAASDMIPSVWRVRMDHADADSITYSVGANVA